MKGDFKQETSVEYSREQKDVLKMIAKLIRNNSQNKARLQCLWLFIMQVNKETGIEPPEDMFYWFDDDGIPINEE